MNISINVNFQVSLSAETLGLLSQLLSGKYEPSQVDAAKAVGSETETKTRRTRAPKEEPKLTVAAEAKPAETAAPSEASATDGSITFEMIRELQMELRDKGKQTQVLALMDEWQLPKLSAIKPEDFEKYYNALQALK